MAALLFGFARRRQCRGGKRAGAKVHKGVENKENLVYLRANQKKRVPAANYGKSPVYAYFFDKFTFT